jgi:hypothetical protein
MYAKKLVIASVTLALLAACSKPTETIIPTDMSKWDTELGAVVKKLSEEDQKLLAGYVMRAKLGEIFGKEGVPLGTTIGNALDEQRKWIAEREKQAAEAKALKEKMLQEQAKAEEAINGAVVVTLIAKRELPKNYDLSRYSEEQQFVIGVHNKSEKEISGVKGSLDFIDLFDKKVGSAGFSISEKIKPGGDAKWTGVRDYNQFVDTHKAVWNLEEGKYTTRFKPDMIVFSDGTKLTVPE